jgi:hypothetical protein
MTTVDIRADLTYDPNEVGADCVVECWISQGSRAIDPDFDPQPGTLVTLVDDDEFVRRGRVIRRAGNRVWVQVDIPGLLSASA